MTMYPDGDLDLGKGAGSLLGILTYGFQTVRADLLKV